MEKHCCGGVPGIRGIKGIVTLRDIFRSHQFVAGSDTDYGDAPGVEVTFSLRLDHIKGGQATVRTNICERQEKGN